MKCPTSRMSIWKRPKISPRRKSRKRYSQLPAGNGRAAIAAATGARNRIPAQPRGSGGIRRPRSSYVTSAISAEAASYSRISTSGAVKTTAVRSPCAKGRCSIMAQRTGEPDLKRKSLCAAVAAMSPHYFAELFKTEHGRAPLRHVLLQRIVAQDRVFGTLGAGLSKGWTRRQSPRHFARMFSKFLGASPSRFSIRDKGSK
jgi:AraC-like DNA-binding protein